MKEMRGGRWRRALHEYDQGGGAFYTRCTSISPKHAEKVSQALCSGNPRWRRISERRERNNSTYPINILTPLPVKPVPVPKFPVTRLIVH